jgi:Tfp pilus assembly protein PilO
MKRATLLLTVLGLVLVLAAWFMFVWSPRAEAITETEASIVDVQAQQATTQNRIAELQGVREQAPQLQAELAAAESLLPRDTALPSALRQLQTAADESQATLVSVSPARPEAVENATPGLFAMTLSAELRGTYFQIVDVLRRLEDPAISPRGIVWDSAGMGVDETAPNLTVTLTGRMFAVLPSPPAPGAEDPEGATAEAADGTDTETEVEVEQEDGQ